MDNYIVSARKYRPATFESVVGQHALTGTLRNAIRSKHLAHAYLFCGPRGVGKTTCARIFAKTINCLDPHTDSDACNECESCVAFNEQRSFNIHELDAASNNSVDAIRALIEQTRVPPQIGKYSVYIIDEVHMLSQGAFNALLKTLEEPPSYVIFILATTEKHKVLPTILSRCQVYDFARITLKDIVAHLQYVAAQEGITASEEALNVIAQKADGGMRDALSIFDQLAAFCGNNISYEQTIDILNVLDSDYYFRVVDLALQTNVVDMLLLFNSVLGKGFDANHFVTGLMKHLRDLLVSKDKVTLPLLETSDSVRERYSRQAGNLSPQWIFKALDILNDCDIQYRTAKNKRLTVELALVKLCRLAMPQVNEPVNSQPSSQLVSHAAPQSAKTPAASAPVPQAPPNTSATAPKKTVQQLPSMPKLQPLPVMPSLNTAKPVSQPQQEQPAKPSGGQNSPFTLDQFLDAWAGLSKVLKDEPRLLAVLEEHKPQLIDNTKCELTLANPWQQKEFRKYGKIVMDYMRSTLHNDALQLELKVSQYEHTHQAYTAEEKYKVLSDTNPELKNLKEVLNLQLE